MKRLLALFLLFSLPARAAEGLEIEPLNFGQGIITDNSSVRSCVVPAGGTQTCDPEIVLLQPGRFGVFRLSGYDPNVEIWASVDDSLTILAGPGGMEFDVKDFTFNPDISTLGTAMLPEADGTLIIEIGATLQTRAGVIYDVAPYRGTYTLQINY
jgi:hypothetical protein